MVATKGPGYLPLYRCWEQLAREECPPGERIGDFRKFYVAQRLIELRAEQERNGAAELLRKINGPHDPF